MKHVLCALLILAAVMAADNAVEGTSEAPMGEWIEVSSFVETDAETLLAKPGFPVPLTEKQKKTTLEPQYYGENKKKPAVYIQPEYMVPKKNEKKTDKKPKYPTTFKTTFFAPQPKLKFKTVQPTIPFTSAQTPTSLAMNQKGWIQAGVDPRAPYPMEKKDNKENPLAPAPIVKLMEIDSNVESVSETETEQSTEVHAPPFVPEGLIHPVVVASAEEFYSHADDFLAPDYADEHLDESASEAPAVEAVEELPVFVEEEADQADEQAEEEAEAAEEQAEAEALAEENSEEENSEEDAAEEENSEEGSDEEENSEEEAAQEEAAEENEEAAEESMEERFAQVIVDQAEAELEAEEEEEQETEAEEEEESEETDSFLEEETSADNEEDKETTTTNNNEQSTETEQTETQAEASEDEIMNELNQYLTSEQEHPHTIAANQEVAALEEEAEVTEEETSEDEEVDALLVEVDEHLASPKGTPGGAVPAGMTWEDAQLARLDAIHAAMKARDAATPKHEVKVLPYPTIKLGLEDDSLVQPEMQEDSAAPKEFVENVELAL